MYNNSKEFVLIIMYLTLRCIGIKKNKACLYQSALIRLAPHFSNIFWSYVFEIGYGIFEYLNNSIFITLPPYFFLYCLLFGEPLLLFALTLT